MHSAWFESWDSLYKVFVSSVTGYLVLVAFVRFAGKRATSKMNNFDWIVTVAVGSVLASMAVLKDVTVADGVLSIALLLGLQYLLTVSTSRWEWSRNLFLAPPRVLYLQGKFQEAALRQERISREEVLSAVRESGVGSLQDVYAVILEPNADLAVVNRQGQGRPEALETVRGFESVHQ